MNIWRYIPGQRNGEALEAAVNGLCAPTAPALLGSDGAAHEPWDLYSVTLIGLADGRLAAGVLVACDPAPFSADGAPPPAPLGDAAPTLDESPSDPPEWLALEQRPAAAVAYGGAPFYEDGPHAAPVAKAVARPDGQALTDKQLKAIYAIGRASRHLHEDEVNAQAVAQYGRRVSELTKNEASQFIDTLKGAVAA